MAKATMRKMAARLCAAALLVSSSVAMPATAGAGASSLVIRGDRGGQIIDYALRVKQAMNGGRAVAILGTCDSACTLFLQMPSSQLCISGSARFGFHLPYGASAAGNRMARDYLLRAYPGWVKAWIRSQGGLSSGMKVMTASYASRFLRRCTSEA